MKKQKKRRSIQQILLSTLIGLLLWSFYWIVGAYGPVRLPASDQPTELYANQLRDDLRTTISRAIAESKQSVLLIIYALTDDRVIQSLRQKSEEGIPVRVICDAKASPHVVERLGPSVQVLRRFSDGLMHQKILVIDGEQCWIGSANMTGESLQSHGNLVNALHSQELAAFLTAKADSVGEYESGEPFLHRDFVAGGQSLEMWLLPDDSHAVKRLIQLIRSAQKTIRVAMFTWTRQDLAQEIIDAKKRGVDADVVIDYQSGKGASAKIVQMLKKGGVPIALSPSGPLLHHKLLYIDGTTLVNGSANWTKAAFTKNDDCFIILHMLTPEQTQHLDDLWQVIKRESTPCR